MNTDPAGVSAAAAAQGGSRGRGAELIGGSPLPSPVDAASLQRATEWLLVLGLLFFLSEAVRLVLLNPGGQGSTVLRDDPSRAPVQLGIYVSCAFLALERSALSLRAMRAAWPFWLLTLLAIASTAWSVDPSQSLRQGIWLSATGFLGMHFDLRYSVSTQLKLLGLVFGAVIILSALFIAYVPDLGLEPSLHAGAWRGAFIHKNSLGRAMALAALIYLLLLPASRRSMPFVVAGLAGAIVLSLYSLSATAPVLLLLLIALVPARVLLKRRVLSLWGLSVVAVAAALVLGWTVSENADDLLELVGRDASLSGRPFLWLTLLSEIADRPFLGFGLGAFWKGSTGAAAAVENIVRWNPGQAHNGFIDSVLDLGLAGALVLLLGLVAAIRRALIQARDGKQHGHALWPLGFLVFFIASNMTESSILRANTIFWFLAASVFTRVMYREARDEM